MTPLHRFANFPQAGTQGPFERLDRLQKDTLKIGYDTKTGWDKYPPMVAHLRSEIDEFEETLVNKESKARQQDELGDVLYIASMLGFRTGLSPKKALDDAVDKYITRFHAMQDIIREEMNNIPLTQVTGKQWKNLWKAAKLHLAGQ